jgi:beta-lactamase class A
MRAKKIRLNKAAVYGGALGVGLLAFLNGDTLRSMPIAPAPVAPLAVIAINPDDWMSLADAVSMRADQYGGTVGYIIKDFKSGQIAASHADLSFPSASLIKFPFVF